MLVPARGRSRFGRHPPGSTDLASIAQREGDALAGVAEAEQVGAVHALGGGGEAQQEPWGEVGDDPAVGGGGGVVELVDDHVVELGGGELVEDARAGPLTAAPSWPARRVLSPEVRFGHARSCAWPKPFRAPPPGLD